MSNQAYEVVPSAGGRHVISQPGTGAILDDAQGYGYKTLQSAEKAAWYKFKGGQARKKSAKIEAVRFWRAHKEFAIAVNEALEISFKEIALGEIEADAEVSKMATERNIEGFDAKFLEYLP